MMERQDLLVEIQTEELPPKALPELIKAFAAQLTAILADNKLDHGEVHQYATPRRLALHIEMLLTHQPDQKIERRGPNVKVAFDQEGNPLPACVGFAKSCGVVPEQLSTIETDKGTCLYFELTQAGKATKTLLATVIKQALSKLPIPKPMRWGNSDIQFIRPVHGSMLLFGKEVIEAEILGTKSSNQTVGHRFLCHQALTIKQASDYVVTLRKKAFVIACFQERKILIEESIGKVISKCVGDNAYADMDANLLDEVAALVEWPVVLIGQFDEMFLTIPSQALISSMQTHQKCFAIKDGRGKLLPYFVIVSNIASTNPKEVIHGNERVMRARLSDAAFFYNTDCSQTLNTYNEKLKAITYQEKLGSMHDKTQRVVLLAEIIAEKISADVASCRRAASLCKADLMTQMVGEFPELQGVMGGHYAKNDGESATVAEAIREHYLPRFSGDTIPLSKEGAAVALADRVDSLVGLFGVGVVPTGDKDPFGLKRAALAVVRIMIEMELHLDLGQLIQSSIKSFSGMLEQQNKLLTTLMQFINDRFRSYVLEHGISSDVFQAVLNINVTEPLSAYCRMKAVQQFKLLAEATNLAAANKRVSNILAKIPLSVGGQVIDDGLLDKAIEKKMVAALCEKKKVTKNLLEQGDYQAVLRSLAELNDLINCFFEEVMIMVDDKAIQKNRIAILQQLRQLFLQVADVAVLQ